MKTKRKRKPRPKKADPKNWIYTPGGADLVALGVPAKLETHARWLINCVYFHHVIAKREREDYIPLHSDLLSRVYGRTNLIVPTREACVSAGLIEVNKDFTPGVKSMGYRLGPALVGKKFHRLSLAGKRFAGRVKDFRDWATNMEGLDDIGHHLRKWLERVQFVGAGEVIEEIARTDPDKAALAHEQIRLFAEDRVIRSKRCDYGRFHSNMTGLVSEVRHSCLSFDGVTPLVEIDIVNSQPYVLACLVVGKISSNHIQSQSNPSNTQSQSSLPDVYHSDTTLDFFHDVQDGTLYEKFRLAAGLNTIGETKDRFFFELYGRTWMGSPTLDALYPDLADVLRAWKRREGYRAVPRAMQRLESTTMIDGVVGRLMREHPDLGVVTCHDSILCEPHHVPLVLQIIREEHRDHPWQPGVRIDGKAEGEWKREMAHLCERPDGRVPSRIAS